MNDLKISDMLRMQYELWEKYSDTWEPLEPKYGRDSLLYMIEEMGEAISIIKKRGEDNVISDVSLTKKFIEELTNILMYFNDVLLKYGITSEEFSDIYLKKHEKNMKRNSQIEHDNYFIN
ncbi:MAG: nucleotide pyrophosphohydrolase [Oscillospiraceae bacterium]|nr:nucleotide pyrophosphohydrolase [Oscillospiraceae bacterium]